MTKQISAETQEAIRSKGMLSMNVTETDADLDGIYDAGDTVAYEQVGLGQYWGTDDSPREPVVFVGFPKNFKSRADCSSAIPVQEGIAVRYEQPMGESVPYEEMGLSRFL
ncbi:hypothetical protein LJC19_05580 [Oxalobacter sp. OttesenSCG-928-P03]|nr:hypothetical protein [Oxalobacter sp. OttesenSCG-928-P03]